MRRISAVAFTLTTIVLAACSDDRLPTAPEVAGGPAQLSITIYGCVDKSLILFPNVDTEVTSLIGGSPTFGPGLFIGDNRQSSLSMWENIKKDKLDSRPLQSHIDNETKFTLNQLGIGGIQDPDGPGGFTAVTGSIRMLDLIFRCTGETPTTLPEPPEGFNADWEIVKASIDQQVTTAGGDASVFVPANTLPEGSLLVIVGTQPSEVQVNTPFTMLSNTVDIAVAGGQVAAGKKLSILVCPSPLIPEAVNARAVLAHQKTPRQPGDAVGTGVEYLDPPQNGTLMCPEQVGLNWRMEKGFFKQRTMQLASYAKKTWRLVTPRPLYAAHAMIGGSVEGLSPIVAVDPYVETAITDVSIPTTTYGETIDFSATLRVSTVPATCGLPASPAVCSWVGQPVTAALPGIPALTLSALQITAVVDGQTQSDAIDPAGGANFSFTRVNAGTNQTANLSFPRVINEPANAPDFAAGNATATYTVNPRPLTVSATPDEWVYGTPEPVEGTFTADQVKYLESVTPTFTTERDALTDVGTYPGALVADVVFGTGVRAANYNVTRNNATLTIIPAPLTITSNNVTREYGVVNPSPSDPYSWTRGNISGLKNGQTFALEHIIVLDPTTDVGTYTIAVTPQVVGLSGNYVVSQVNAGALIITPAPIDFTIDAGTTHVYGDANSFTSTLGATRNDDVLAVGFSPPASTLLAFGSNVITGTLSGAKVGNYSYTTPTANLLITARALSGGIDNKTKTEGQANPPLTGSVGNNVAGDGFVITYGTTATTGSAAGSYPIFMDLSVAGGGNYSWNNGNDGTLAVVEPPQLASVTIAVTPAVITGGTSPTLQLSFPALTSSASTAASVSLTISGCGSGIVTKVGGAAVGAADLGTTISVSAPNTLSTDDRVCSYTLTVANAATPPATAVATGTLTVNADIPNPILAYRHSEQYTANNQKWDRYRLTVTNRASYPASLFAINPSAPACASNALVNIYDGTTNAYIYGFCGLSAPDQLNDIWFAVPRWTQPPASVYITITDQAANVTYTSNTINLYAPLFVNSPREVLFNGTNSVAGATSYALEVQICDSWASPDWRTCSSTWVAHRTATLPTDAWSSTQTVAGDNTYRWRVVARNSDGVVVNETDYKHFRYITGPGAP